MCIEIVLCSHSIISIQISVSQYFLGMESACNNVDKLVCISDNQLINELSTISKRLGCTNEMSETTPTISGFIKSGKGTRIGVKLVDIQLQ